jgi:hypothetical protein
MEKADLSFDPQKSEAPDFRIAPLHAQDGWLFCPQ